MQTTLPLPKMVTRADCTVAALALYAIATDVVALPPGGVALILNVPPVGLPDVAIVCTALQQALAIFWTETEMPRIFAVAGTPRLKPVVSWFTLLEAALMTVVA